MTNMCLKSRISQGYSTLLMALMVLMSMTILASVSASTVITHQKGIVDEHMMQKSFNAAQAGIDYGIKYLDQNYATIANNQVINGSLADGSEYSTRFVFQGDKNTINIQSLGTAGGVSTSANQIVVYKGSGIIGVAPSQPLTVRGIVDLNGNARINNDEGATNITAGGAIRLRSTAATYIGGAPSSNRFLLAADVAQNDSAVAARDNAALQTLYLGQSVDTLASAATLSLTKTGSYNYNTELNGQVGKTIALTQTSGAASIVGSNSTIGSSAAPVNLVVNGDLSVTGSSPSDNIKINGNVIVTGKLILSGNVEVTGLVLVLGNAGVELKGNAKITGGLVAGGNSSSALSMVDNARISYSKAALDNTLARLPGAASADAAYGRIAGSWHDFNNS